MAIILVTYDLKQPGRNYQPVHDYLRQYTHCKNMESVWLLDTTANSETIRDHLGQIIDANDVVFVTRLYAHQWAAWRYPCGHWLNQPGRNW